MKAPWRSKDAAEDDFYAQYLTKKPEEKEKDIQYESNTREKAANALMWSPSSDKPILIPCCPAFPNYSDVRIDKTSNHPKQWETDT